MSDILDDEEMSAMLKKCPEWEQDGESIVRTVEFEEYMEGIDFVNEVAELAEDAQHHPEIIVVYGSVQISLTTHDEGGVTELDFEMAQRIDNLID